MRRSYESVPNGARHDLACECPVCSRIRDRRRTEAQRGVITEIQIPEQNRSTK